VPAPWCGYTTLSPILYKLTSSLICDGRLWSQQHRRPQMAVSGEASLPESLEKRQFCRDFGGLLKKPLLK
jgi:hypothetical protein